MMGIHGPVGVMILYNPKWLCASPIRPTDTYGACLSHSPPPQACRPAGASSLTHGTTEGSGPPPCKARSASHAPSGEVPRLTFSKGSRAGPPRDTVAFRVPSSALGSSLTRGLKESLSPRIQEPESRSLCGRVQEGQQFSRIASCRSALNYSFPVWIDHSRWCRRPLLVGSDHFGDHSRIDGLLRQVVHSHPDRRTLGKR